MTSPREALRVHTQHLGRRVIADLSNAIERNAEPRMLDSLVFLVEQMYRCIDGCGDYHTADIVAEAAALLLSVQIDLDDTLARASETHLFVKTGKPGRPSYFVSDDQLVNLLQIGFSVPRIAKMLCVSVRTVRRRMEDLDVRVADFYSCIHDHVLDSIITNILLQFPNTGYRMMAGHLKQHGVRVTQHRIRESLHRVAPASIASRWSASIARRVYSVRSPMSLWHIDGNHKLIRYVMMSDIFIIGILCCAKNNVHQALSILFSLSIDKALL